MNLLLIDTGGLEPDSGDIILSKIKEQADVAIDNADVILFVTDITAGLTATDMQIADILRRSGKPVLVCVNKCDRVGDVPPEFYESFTIWAWATASSPVSSVHGHGTGDLLDAACALFPARDGKEQDEQIIKVAIVGKPNVGKSSLLNRILGVERSIVSDMAGTTRDAIDAFYENESGKYLLIDTAGVRRKSRVEESVERHSVLRAFMAVERADVVLILIDARDGVTEQGHQNRRLCRRQGVKPASSSRTSGILPKRTTGPWTSPAKRSARSSALWTTRRFCLSRQRRASGSINCSP